MKKLYIISEKNLCKKQLFLNDQIANDVENSLILVITLIS